jgi:hypothetical protein
MGKSPKKAAATRISPTGLPTLRALQALAPVPDQQQAALADAHALGVPPVITKVCVCVRVCTSTVRALTWAAICSCAAATCQSANGRAWARPTS